MTYISLQTEHPEQYRYQLKVAHLFGDLMNTYGDNGNILMLKYIAEKLNAAMTIEIVSLGDSFDDQYFDLTFWGGGQDYEQEIISDQLEAITPPLSRFIEDGKPMLAICGGYQFLGQYYILASGKKIPTTGILGHYTVSGGEDRIIGDVEIHNEEFNESYYGFENHGGRTYLADNEKPLGKVVYGGGNNGSSGEEGLHYKNTFGSYFHGPLLSRNARIAYRLVTTALKQKYGEELELASYEDLFSNLDDKEVMKDFKRKVEEKS
ncbi:lipid II isoglutaminyl synthase subunit GatD [Lactococcus termiticola]|uniref:Lipid II isoglutaminyl synthase (glutamine-hydrolyzing) subunit GatD n=1 Tax=Lactococcus termiticola TaxID=2169526 RepID=A0A2R5HK24_9LACT|nr:lipid II isoglutaminyl synthase subunit GatD [Lactococcus termiticola]GBG97090.1 glutamine amidotransferase [Lactococcus termiticola]